MSNITKDKLKEIVVSHNKWLRNEEGGQRADISYVTTSISFASFRHSLGSDRCSLRGANFRSSNLKNARFIGSHLERCEFNHADLKCAKLYDATFTAELYSADSLHDISVNKNAFHFLMLNLSFAKNPVCRFPWKSPH